MSRSDQPIAPFSFTAAALTLAGVSVAVACVCSAVLMSIWRTDHLALVWGIGAMSYMIAVFSQAPVRVLSPVAVEGAGLGFVVGVLIRMGFTAIALLALLMFTALDPASIAGWTLGWYLILLIAEVMLVVKYLGVRTRAVAQREVRPC